MSGNTEYKIQAQRQSRTPSEHPNFRFSITANMAHNILERLISNVNSTLSTRPWRLIRRCHLGYLLYQYARNNFSSLQTVRKQCCFAGYEPNSHLLCHTQQITNEPRCISVLVRSLPSQIERHEQRPYVTSDSLNKHTTTIYNLLQ